ncbi:MAG: hypothetical protein ABW151_16205 [Pseudorhodoplanes sp.]
MTIIATVLWAYGAAQSGMAVTAAVRATIAHSDKQLSASETATARISFVDATGVERT